jgi:carotenoid phi-ring synthase / carotenoid chi-ring synthase
MSAARHVVVLGGGLAGMAAATILVERGVSVTVVEREAYLGGRAGAWRDRLADGRTFHMERGFHAFFRQYQNLRALLRRVDPHLHDLVALDDYPVLGPNGARESFAGLSSIPLVNVAELVLRSRSFKLRDLVRANLPSAHAMLAYDHQATYAELDHLTASAYLDELAFPDEARRMLFDVFAHSFFNPERDYSAAELLSMFHFYFLRNPFGLVFDVARRPLSTILWDPLRAHVEARGATIHLETAAVAIDRDARGFVVHVQAAGAPSTIPCDAVVVALDVAALARLVTRSPILSADLPAVRELDVTAPFAVLRLFLDTPPRADRPAFATTSRFGILDSIAVYEKLEDESRAYADETGGSVIELHAYAVPDGHDEARVRRELHAGLIAAYPELQRARVREDRFLFRQDCPAFRPGSDATRPTGATSVPRIVLAGDFVKLPFPSALMERAVSSGMIAANTLLGSWGLPREPVLHGATRGYLAFTRDRSRRDNGRCPPTRRATSPYWDP